MCLCTESIPIPKYEKGTERILRSCHFLVVIPMKMFGEKIGVLSYERRLH